MPAPSTTPLISVALCTYNGTRYLREQLDSVLTQTGVTIEVVALDDGSQDDTCTILEEFASRDTRVRWQRNERNLGPTASFERAMALCNGDFIAPCDQDDLWHPEKLALLLGSIRDCDLAYCDSEFMTADGQSMQRRLSEGRQMLRGTSPVGFLFGNSVSGHASLLRRELFERARPFPKGAYHDWWLALCAAGRNGLSYLDRPLVRFRRHDSAFSPMGKSSSSRGSDSQYRAWLEQHYVLMQTYATVQLRDSDIAAQLAGAMRLAIDEGHNRRLMRLVWQQRHALPRFEQSVMVNAWRMQLRLRRKLRRARRAVAEQSPD